MHRRAATPRTRRAATSRRIATRLQLLVVRLLAVSQLELPPLEQLQVQEVSCSTNWLQQSAGDNPA